MSSLICGQSYSWGAFQECIDELKALKNVVLCRQESGSRSKKYECKDCNMFRLRAFLPRNSEDHLWIVTELELEHGNLVNGITTPCLGIKKPTGQLSLCAEVFRSTENKTKVNGKKVSTAVLRSIVAEQLQLGSAPTVGVIKYARRLHKKRMRAANSLPGMGEDYVDISKLDCLLTSLKALNPSLHYNIGIYTMDYIEFRIL